MKYYYLFILAFVAIFASCDNDDNSTSGGQSDPAKELSVDDCPTWTPVEMEQSTGNSMSVDVAINLSHLSLSYETDTADMVAAFINGTCREVAHPNYDAVTSSDSTDCVFIITVKKSSTDDVNAPVTLMFYSAKLKHIFTAPTFAYQDESSMGTVSNPYKPQWQK